MNTAEIPARFDITPNGEPTILMGEFSPNEPVAPDYAPDVAYTFDPPESVYTSPVGEKLQPYAPPRVHEAPGLDNPGLQSTQEQTPARIGEIIAQSVCIGAAVVFDVSEFAARHAEERVREEKQKQLIRQELKKLAAAQKRQEQKRALGRNARQSAAIASAIVTHEAVTYGAPVGINVA